MCLLRTFKGLNPVSWVGCQGSHKPAHLPAASPVPEVFPALRSLLSPSSSQAAHASQLQALPVRTTPRTTHILPIVLSSESAEHTWPLHNPLFTTLSPLDCRLYKGQGPCGTHLSFSRRLLAICLCLLGYRREKGSLAVSIPRLRRVQTQVGPACCRQEE